MSSWDLPWGRVNSGKYIISDQTAAVRWKKDSLEGDSSDQMFTIHIHYTGKYLGTPE